MSYQMIQQENGRSHYVNLLNGVDTVTVTASRVNVKALGFTVPHTRINMLTQIPLSWNPTGCADACTAPAELQRNVRIIVSGPTISKVDLIAALQQQLDILQTSQFDPVWMGYNPTPGNIVLAGE